MTKRRQEDQEDCCFASLLHGDNPEYLAFACVLGRRLATTSRGPRRILLCGPGQCTKDPAVQKALICAGWQELRHVNAIVAEHLDKTKTKRHALVFTKLRVLELAYRKVLLLDLDLFPRLGANLSQLFQVESPAARYHCAQRVDKIKHGSLIPADFQVGIQWCPNAGVMRLDPLQSTEDREAQVSAIERDIERRHGATYLPEQYYLAEKFKGWRNIGLHWNFEVWPEWDDPEFDEPREDALKRAQEKGWAGYYDQTPPPRGEEVLQDVRVWHFSGKSWDTDPSLFMDAANAEEMYAVAERQFRHRDPSRIVATALFEWRAALEEMIAEPQDEFDALREAAATLADRAKHTKQAWWYCGVCAIVSNRMRKKKDGMRSGGPASELWLCADCAVARLRSSLAPQTSIPPALCTGSFVKVDVTGAGG